MAGRDEREEPFGGAEDGADDGDEPQPPASLTDLERARRLAGAREYIHTLPSTERRIATLAAEGQPVWAIAQAIGISEAAVARTLDGVLAAVEGRELSQVETGGLGADTDPGVTGGYGDTGFGALDTEPPAFSGEPDEDVDWSDEENGDEG